ncbi:MAG: hypothetical protein IPF54_03595 [Draconibacterium sp.]|nr:hypothetical protein [Draconibacterium sp.]
MKQILPFIILMMFFFSCEKENSTEVAPELPPVETMIVDFGKIADITKSADIAKTNWLYSATTVGWWSIITGTTFAIPVAAFRSAIEVEPTYIDNLTWEWNYSVDGFTSQYSARLVGKLLSKEVKWEMYISKTGIQPFDEFLWFEGTSNIDGNSGQWILYHSSAFPEKTIQIDWKKETEKVGEIKYTYIREKNDQRQTDSFNGSTLTYGLQKMELDIFVNIHAYNAEDKKFNDSFIEWNSTNYFGHVKAENFFNDSNWHCWDSQGNDILCD